jgi:SOS-response transcriptional repressor LexA
MLDDKKTFKDLIIAWNNGTKDGALATFADAIGVRIANVSHWAAGRYEPSDTITPKILEVLKINQEQLRAALARTKAKRTIYSAGDKMARARHALAEPMTLPAQLIPVLGTVSAEKFRFSFQSIPDEYIAAPASNGHECFALKVKGECMQPNIYDGEYVIVAKTDYVDDGQMAIVNIGDDCTLKRVFRHGSEVELKPDNPNFQSITTPAASVRVLGKITGAFRKI